MTCISDNGFVRNGYGYYPEVYGCSSHNSATIALDQDKSEIAYVWSKDVTAGVVIDAALHNELIEKASEQRYHWHKDSTELDNQLVVAGTLISSDVLKILRDNLLQAELNYTDLAPAWTVPSFLQDEELERGDIITAEQLNELRNRVNQLRQACSCNCNYCTCNCNYCTCNCNYSCTCNCNYSDERLKKEIRFF